MADLSRKEGKRFKVWTSDKGVGKVIFANTFGDLVEKAKSKLEIEGQVKIVLDDSCEIDDDDALGGVADMASLFVLAENQELTLPSSSGQNSEDRLKAIMHSLKKRKIDSQKRPFPANLKFSIGWFNYSAKLKRYVNAITIDDDSDSDFDLPEISFRRQEHTAKCQQTVQNNSGLDMISNRNTEQTTPLLQSVSVTSGNTYVSAGTPTVSFNIDNNRCTICYERNKESFFIPCGHTVCTVCAVTQQSGNSSCPYCRATIQGIGNIHN